MRIRKNIKVRVGLTHIDDSVSVLVSCDICYYIWSSVTIGSAPKMLFLGVNIGKKSPLGVDIYLCSCLVV